MTSDNKFWKTTRSYLITTSIQISKKRNENQLKNAEKTISKQFGSLRLWSLSIYFTLWAPLRNVFAQILWKWNHDRLNYCSKVYLSPKFVRFWPKVDRKNFPNFWNIWYLLGGFIPDPNFETIYRTIHNIIHIFLIIFFSLYCGGCHT